MDRMCTILSHRYIKDYRRHFPAKGLKVLIIINNFEEYMKLTIAAFKIMRSRIFFYFEFPFHQKYALQMGSKI